MHHRESRNLISFSLVLAYFQLQHTIDEVENLIKKHEAFEKSAAAQEERFAALERLTTVRGNSVQCFEPYWIQMINKISLHFCHKSS